MQPPVSDNLARETVVPHYHVDNDLKKAWDVDGHLDWLVINHLYEPIDNDKNWVITIPFLIRQNW